MRSLASIAVAVFFSLPFAAALAQEAPAEEERAEGTSAEAPEPVEPSASEPTPQPDAPPEIERTAEPQPADLPAATLAPAPDEDPIAPSPGPEPTRPDPEPEFGIRATGELGFLGVLAHDIRLGSDGTPIDYVNDGAQNNLFFFARLAVEVDVWRQHHITFLYQPLEIATEATLRRDLRIDGLDYAEGTPVSFFYGFPFFRLSWDFNVLDGRDELLAFGLGLQIRNANISFRSLDGELYRARNDIGPVPLLRARGRVPLPSRFFFAFEVDGFYAPISVLNGSDNEVTGAILDASIRFGWRVVDHADVFLNLRYLAGGAVGAGSPTPTSDGEQSNWLHFMTLSLGATIDSRP